MSAPRKNTAGAAMTPEQIAEYKRQALERYEQQQRKNTDPPPPLPPAATTATTSPQRPVSPRKGSRSAVSLTPEQIAEYKKQAQEYYSQAKSGEASSPAAAGARKVSNADSMPVFRGATNSDAPSNLPNWSRKKSVLTPIPPAELLAAMNSQAQPGEVHVPRPGSTRVVSPMRPGSERKDGAASVISPRKDEPAPQQRSGSDRPLSPRSRGGLANLTPEQIAEIKAKAQQDYEQQQRENEELRQRLAAGANRKPAATTLATMLTPEQIAEYKAKAQQDYERQQRENAAAAVPQSPRVQMDPEQAAEYKRKMQDDYERQQRENEEIRKRKEEEARQEAAARANMTPEQVAEYKRKMQEEYERQQRENEEIRRRKEEEEKARDAAKNMSPEEVAEYKRQALIKYEQQRRENERLRKQKEDEAKQAMAGTFTRQSMAPGAARRQPQPQFGGPQLVDDLVDEAPPMMVPMRGVSPQRQLASLSYIEVAPMKAERRVPPPSAAPEDDDRLKPVQVSPRLAGGAKARTSARMKTVLVTGATGFIGSHVVKALMSAGYRVRALIRRLNSRSPSLLQTLRDLAPGAAHPLQLVDGDLTIKESLDEPMNGVDLVVHCAGVMNFAPVDPFADMLKPVVLGTLALLSAVKTAKTVEKVVIISAAAAIHDVPDPSKIYDESSWNEIAKIDNNPYAFSKVEQESNANRFLNQLPEAERFELVVLNPTTVLGPLLTREVRSTAEITYHLMAGNLPLVPHWGTGVAAFEKPNAQGRYILNSRSTWLVDIAKELNSLFPAYNIGTTTAPTLVTLALPLLDSKLSFGYLWSNLGSIAYYDTSRSKSELGMAYTPFEDTLHDAGESIIQLGLLPNKTGGESQPSLSSYSSYQPQEEGMWARMTKMFW